MSQLRCASVLETNKEPQGLLAFVNFLHEGKKKKKKTSNIEGHASIRDAHFEGEPKWDVGNSCRFRGLRYYILNSSTDLALSRSLFFLGNYKTISLHRPWHSVHTAKGKLKSRIDFMASENWHMNFKDAAVQTAVSLSWNHLSYAESQHWAQQKLSAITIPKSG